MTASQIVSKLLEYAGHEEWKDRPGGENDWLRGKKLLTPLAKDLQFTAQRPGGLSGESEAEEKEEKAKPEPKMSPHTGRFKWKPKTTE